MAREIEKLEPEYDGALISAEWLLKNHIMLDGLEAALSERIKQLLNPPNETDIIENLQLHSSMLDGMPHGQSNMSRTETAVTAYPELLTHELEMNQKELLYVKQQFLIVQHCSLLYRAVIAGLTQNEKWLIQKYYDEQSSLDEIARLTENSSHPLSKSTLRRRKIQTVHKVQKLIGIIGSMTHYT